MRNLTIFKMLGLGYIAILLIVIALGTYSTLKLRQLNQITRYINSNDAVTIRLAESLRDAFISQRNFEQKYVISRDKDFYLQFLDTEKYIRSGLEQINVYLDTEEKRLLIDNTKESFDQYVATVQEEFDLISGNRNYSQKSFEEKKEALSEEIITKLREFSGVTTTDMNGRIELSGSVGLEASRVAVILTIVSAILAILIAFLTARTINRPIDQLIKGTREIARGRFEEHLEIAYPPEINELAEAFNHMCGQLKELDGIKADLISNISHEFRTPLAVIREAVGLQLDNISSTAPEKQRRLLGIIGEECERLINTVNKMLNLSRMEAGMMEYQMEKSSLSDLIEMIVSKLRPVAERKGISIELNLNTGLPHAYIDSEKIGQVVEILMDNALKFTQEGGRLSIRAYARAEEKAPDHLSGKDTGLIEVSVKDTGCGIPEDGIKNIFDKFKKYHGKGTGLGLYIARQIISAHGGTIWVQSEKEKGSAFFFTVPVY
jgi:two-component system, NtrC family, sensor histidine kinase GlrK